MKYLVVTDSQGFKRRVMVKDNDNESVAFRGVPSGPPDVREIDWELLKKQVNNFLADSGAFTEHDIQGNSPAIAGALNIFKRHLLSLYGDKVQGG